MIYKAGDKVVMKESRLNTLNSFYEEHDYILTISRVYEDTYLMKENGSGWFANPAIDYLYVEPEIFEPISSRFEILDL